jgi:hypothetical protein
MPRDIIDNQEQKLPDDIGQLLENPERRMTPANSFIVSRLFLLADPAFDKLFYGRHSCLFE